MLLEIKQLRVVYSRVILQSNTSLKHEERAAKVVRLVHQ